MKKAVIILAILLAISAALNIIYIRARVSGGTDGQTRPDTVRLVDTLRYVSPAPVRDTIVRYVRVTAPIAPQPPDTAARAVAATDTMRSINGIADTAAVHIAEKHKLKRFACRVKIAEFRLCAGCYIISVRSQFI